MNTTRLIYALAMALAFSTFTAAALAQSGGTNSTARAVSSAINWLAKYRNADGSWRFDAPSGAEKSPANAGTSKPDSVATGLLPFLGAGQTSMSKRPCSAEVAAAIRWLVQRQNVRERR